MGREEAGARLLLGWGARGGRGQTVAGSAETRWAHTGTRGPGPSSRSLSWTGMREGQLGWRHEIVLLPMAPLFFSLHPLLLFLPSYGARYGTLTPHVTV